MQRNRVRKAIKIFDTIETVDSLRLALKIKKECARSDLTFDMASLLSLRMG